jgi:hypothetical protein
MSPAGAAVLGQVLVADVREEVNAVNIAPVPVCGQVSLGSKGLLSLDNLFGIGSVVNVAWVLIRDTADSEGSSDKKSDESFHFTLNDSFTLHYN